LLFATADAASNKPHTAWLHPDEDYSNQEWGVLNPSVLLDRSGWTETHFLTGNWGGLRNRLYQEGISFIASYESETGGNPIGGRNSQDTIHA
jgi:hypothetical protein